MMSPKLRHKSLTSFVVGIFSAAVFSLVFSTSFAQTPITTDSRIRTLVYNPNEVYELKFYYNYQSFIEFAEDEEIEMISIGEAFAWRLTPAGKRLFVRPLEVAAHTNMTIITNKRTYHFDIRSDEFNGKADEDLVYTIRFFYPQAGQPLPLPPQLAIQNPAPIFTQKVAPAAPAAPSRQVLKTPIPLVSVTEPIAPVVEHNHDQNELNFNYTLAGKSDNIAPLKVYDDSIETFFQFPNDNLVIPAIAAVDENGAENPLPYIIRDNYVVVPAVASQLTLRLADSLLCIYNQKMLAVGR